MGNPSRDAAQPVTYSLRLFRVGPDSSFRLRMLSTSYDGCLTHYAGGRSVWCNPKGCLSPAHKKGPIWKGYCTADLYDEANRWWAPVVFEITETCELSFRGVYRRGQVWLVERDPDPPKKKSPVRATLIGNADAEELPAAPDYMPVLRSVYHAYDLVLGVKNPMPPRVMVQPAKGAPPPDLVQQTSGEEPASAELTHRLIEEFRQRRSMNGSTNGTH